MSNFLFVLVSLLHLVLCYKVAEVGTYLLSALILVNLLVNLTCLSRRERKEQHQGFTVV